MTANGTTTPSKQSTDGTEVAPMTAYTISSADLSTFCGERNRSALADLLERGLAAHSGSKIADVEAPVEYSNPEISTIVKNLRQYDDLAAGKDDHDPSVKQADQYADHAANILSSLLLRSPPESGINPSEVEQRRQVFGTNAIAEKELESFLELCWEAIQDFVLIMLIVLGIINIVLEVTTIEDGKKCTTCWIEGAAILVSVIIVVLVTASIDYAKQFTFLRLTRSLHDTNTKVVIRNGQQVSVIDDDIVVGDILSVNSHSLASIPADCVLLGPASDLKVDESTLTGESHLISKRPGDVVLSGTTAVQGSAKMVVVAVGVHSVAGKIKAQVYESKDHQDELGGGDENSPLFVKLDTIAKRIGVGGACAAAVSLAGSIILGLIIKGEPAKRLVNYVVTAITVLAVAVPEGLPLAVTLALAFSSSKLMKEMNLVKHLDACETMGCATTICTDKTGTLTANKMTARALYTGATNFHASDPSQTLGAFVHGSGSTLDPRLVDMVCRAIAINTMDESELKYAQDKKSVESASGNPTEVALLYLCHELGARYDEIRNSTKGRSNQGPLSEFLAQGKQFGFSSARKMMSWAVPLEGGGYRLYCKGAQEVILSRCTSYLSLSNTVEPKTAIQQKEVDTTALTYSRRGMRCLALSYRDLPADFSLDTVSETEVNSDGTQAFEAETNMTLIALVGIEDPLRKEVPYAIEKCFQAGIDVRLVTGDNPNTAVSIAYQAGILRDSHFRVAEDERVADNLKENVLMEGKEFRQAVYSIDASGNKVFDQAAFDKIWPHLRVLARSSPDDKLTLAHGLNQSNLFADKDACKRLLHNDGIRVFPDRQVIAMTGDGTNDAPALKRADIGFAMGIAGTQIAKDAADIILLDDNFASILTAVKWGRNVYASIQKFLQFQLTVNIVAVVTALTGSFAYQKSPLAAIQLLWVNLLMDSLASLALASEPPTDELLTKPPVNRTESMITKHMWANMIGHAVYQIIVVMTLLFAGPDYFDLERGHIADKRGEDSVHYTLIFNSFVWMQLFNEVNSRKLKGELNVFQGVLRNKIFCIILIVTSILQALIVQFGSIAFHVAKGGLSLKYWGISIAFGAGALPVQQVINVLYRIGQSSNMSRNKRRLKKSREMSSSRLITSPAEHHSHPHAE